MNIDDIGGYYYAISNDGYNYGYRSQVRNLLVFGVIQVPSIKLLSL